MIKYLSIFFSIILLFMMVSPVNASVNLSYHQYTQGGASNFVAERLKFCYMSDDTENNTYNGTLAPGESFVFSWDWCADTDIIMEEGHSWEGSFEGLAVNVQGKGQFSLVLYENNIPLISHRMPDPQKGYEKWHRCATYHNRVDVTGTSYGETTLVLTNIGNKVARNIGMASWIQTNHSTFLNNNCPFRSDWGF